MLNLVRLLQDVDFTTDGRRLISRKSRRQKLLFEAFAAEVSTLPASEQNQKPGTLAQLASVLVLECGAIALASLRSFGLHVHHARCAIVVEELEREGLHQKLATIATRAPVLDGRQVPGSWEGLQESRSKET